MSSPSTVTTTRGRRAALAVATGALGLTLGLTGCSGSSGGTHATAPAPSSSTSSSSSASASASAKAVPVIAPTKAQAQIPADATISEVPALRKTVTLTACKAAPGGWSASGSATNTGAKAQTFHMLVFFTDKYSRTIDFARGQLALAPGKTGTWTATRKFTPPAGTKCVLRGLYSN